MGGAPPPQSDPTDDDADRPVAGRRGGEPEKGPDKRLIWGSVGAGVLIVAVVVGIQIAKKDPAPEKKPDGPKTTAQGEAVMNLDTPEGRAAFEKMLNSAAAQKVTGKIGALSPEAAVKVKDILIPHMLRQDAGLGLTDASLIADRLSGLKDERVLGKIIELALAKTTAAYLLKPYGAMGSQAVIDKAKADPAKADSFYPLLLECKLPDATGPMTVAAETCEIPQVAWICGDALYERELPVAIKLERVQAWLADAELRARASGIRQMALQKGTDRDAALAPFDTAETPRELQIAVMDVVSRHRDLSPSHMRAYLHIDDQELWEEAVKRISEKRLFEYIPDLEELSQRPGTYKARRAGNLADGLKGMQKGMKK
ncbi:MAG: hypothetical protein AAB074_05120 [Planctomycetota bacterium]